jgi:hypothetical protein
MLVLPTKTAPAARSRTTTVASKGGTKPWRIFDPLVVSTPRVQKRSLRATGIPVRGGVACGSPAPAARASSAARAPSRASSAVTVR